VFVHDTFSEGRFAVVSVEESTCVPCYWYVVVEKGDGWWRRKEWRGLAVEFVCECVHFDVELCVIR